jgi:hypothetical protein
LNVKGAVLGGGVELLSVVVEELMGRWYLEPCADEIGNMGKIGVPLGMNE